MKPLVELSTDEVAALLASMDLLAVVAATLRALGISGEVLSFVDSADDLKGLGLSALQARIHFSKVQAWKADGVERLLLVPKLGQSNSSSLLPSASSSPPPPLPAVPPRRRLPCRRRGSSGARAQALRRRRRSAAEPARLRP